LPEPIAVKSVHADLKDGVLTITMPKLRDRSSRHVNVS
jgi:HSP20 family molecular chaperone IbpA